MKKYGKYLSVVAFGILSSFLVSSQEKIDYEMIENIRDEGFNRASFAYNAAMQDQKLPRTPNQMKNNRRWHK